MNIKKNEAEFETRFSQSAEAKQVLKNYRQRLIIANRPL